MTVDDAFRPLARDDVNGQVLWLSKRSPELAWKFLEAVKKTVETIISYPDGGMIWDDDELDGRMPFIRFRVLDGFQKHMVIYSTKTDSVKILRVVHGARKITASMILDD